MIESADSQEHMETETMPEVGTASDTSADAGLATEQPGGDVSEGASDSFETPEYVFTLEDGTGLTAKDISDSYLRQSDYTKKTQELAGERQRLAQAEAIARALEADPEGTIELLRANLLEQADGQQVDDDPLEARFKTVESFIEEQRQAAVVQQVNSTIASLKTKFGEFDADSLLQHAVDHGIPNLEVALIHKRHVDGDTAQATADQQAAAAKQGLPPLANGSRAAGATTGQRRSGSLQSLKQAALEALAEAGLSSFPAPTPY